MSDARATLPPPIHATAADLPPAVAAGLASPGPGEPGSVPVGGVGWATVQWGRPTDPPLLLVHGITASSAIWWRTGPALAEAGYRVTAVDLPGHGRTGHWTGHHRFRDNAADLAAFIREAGIDRADLGVIGHSWGAMTAAALPTVGLRPRVIVLLDPPTVPLGVMAAMAGDPLERKYDHLDEAIAAFRAAYPEWTDGDVRAKAEGLTGFEVAAAESVLLENGDWDGGLAALDEGRESGVPIWLVRGEPATGSLVPDAALPGFAERIGASRILTIAGGAHSPQRMLPEATLVAFVHALGTPGPIAR